MLVWEDENEPNRTLSIGGIMEMYKLTTIEIVKNNIESSEKWGLATMLQTGYQR